MVWRHVLWFPELVRRGEHLTMPELSQRWRSLCARTKQSFEQKAREASAARKVLSDQGLDRVGEGTLEQQEIKEQMRVLSSRQKQRARRDRVTVSLNKIVEHPAWKSGLALSDHISPLRSDFVTAATGTLTARQVSDEIDRIFKFDDQVIENAATSDEWKVPCWSNCGGLCAKSRSYALVKTWETQFQSVLKERKLDTSVSLMRVELCRPDRGVSSEATFPCQWYLLGCAIYRPLTHVLIKLVEEQESALSFCIKDAKIYVCTSHQMFASLASHYESAAGEWRPDAMQIKVSCLNGGNVFRFHTLWQL